MTDFVTKFYNLEGFTIGERQRNLYALLKDQAVLDHQDDIVQNLKPRNYLERQFQIEIFMFLRRTKELLKVVEDGDEIFLSKIIKQPWFIKEVFGDVDVEEFVNKYLLGLSYSSRMKLLKQLCANLPEEKIDLLFDALLTKYGLLIAKQFLSYCSTDKIRKELQTHEITLHPGHLRQFFLKDPELVALYIEECEKRREEKFSDRKFLRFVAEKNLDFFLRLVKKFNLVAPLGRRTTKKITKVRKEDVLNDSEFYVGLLKASKVPRSLQKDFRRFYLNIFPRDIEEVSKFWYYNRYLPYIPKNLRYPLLSDTFYTIYKSKLEDDEELIYNESLLHLMLDSDPELCDKYASIKYHETKDERYLRCMLTDKALAILKARFNRSLGMLDKRRYVECMVKVCAFKKDLKGLEDVMDFFSGKQKSVDNNIRNDFLTAVCGRIPIGDLTEKHWNHLMNIVTILIQEKNYYFSDSMVYRYVEYFYSLGKPINDLLKFYVEHIFKSNYVLHRDKKINEPELLKQVFMKILEGLPSWNKDNNLYHDFRILEDILCFNKKYPDKKIDIYGDERLVNILLTTNFVCAYYVKVIECLICRKNRNEIDTKIMDFYFKNIIVSYNHNDPIVRWFFKHDLKNFTKYFENILDVLLNESVNLWSKLKRYSHLKLDNMAISYLLSKLNTEENIDERIKLIEPLALILSTDTFLQLTNQYMPKAKTINLEDQTDGDLGKLQFEIARMYKKCGCMKSILPSLLKYCIGDYLGSALSSLYSALHRIPEKNVPLIVETLARDAVSVRKHALFLTCSILDQKYVLNLYRTLAGQEKNISIKKHMYSSIVKYFRNHPSQECWKLVEIFINLTDKADRESLRSFSRYKIVHKYKSIYWQTVWTFLESNQITILDVSSYMDKHLRNATGSTFESPSDLPKTIIETYFLNDEEELGMLPGIIKYTLLFLLYGTNDERFKIVFDVMDKRKKSDLHVNFFSEFVEMKVDEKFTADAVEAFFNEWFKIFTPSETFREFLILKGLKIFIENRNDLIGFSKGFVGLIEDTVESYSGLIVEEMIVHLKYFVELMFNDKSVAKVKFVNCLEDHKRTNATTVVCLYLCEGFSMHEKKKCKDLLRKVSQSGDEAVLIMCNLLRLECVEVIDTNAKKPFKFIFG